MPKTRIPDHLTHRIEKLSALLAKPFQAVASDCMAYGVDALERLTIPRAQPPHTTVDLYCVSGRSLVLVVDREDAWHLDPRHTSTFQEDATTIFAGTWSGTHHRLIGDTEWLQLVHGEGDEWMFHSATWTRDTGLEWVSPIIDPVVRRYLGASAAFPLAV